MTDVVLSKLNESSIRIIANRGILEEISDEYKFFVESARFQKSYKEKLWDGYIRLFSRKDQTIGHGLLSSLCAWCAENNYSYSLEGFQPHDEKSIEEIQNFCGSLKSTTDKGEIIEYWDSQINGVHHAINARKCILQSPTNSGKSLIIYSIIRYLIDVEKISGKILLVVPTISLVNQMFSDFCEYSVGNQWPVDVHCHKIMSGIEKDSHKQVYISTWQSIYNLPEKYFQKFEALVGDECHTFKAQETSSIITKSNIAKWKIGTTGTTGSPIIDKMQLRSLFGEIKILTTNKEQIDKGRSAEIKIVPLHIKRKDQEICKIVSGYSYEDEMDYIYADKKRNELIVQLAGKQKEVTLILFTKRAHGKALYQKLVNQFPNRKIYYVDGTVPGETREEIRKKVQKEQDSILVCSFKTFSTGINIKNLNVLIFAGLMKSEIKILQSIGRILRIGNSKNVVLYDVVDDFSYKKKKNYALEHFLIRVSYYQTEGFPIKLRSIEL